MANSVAIETGVGSTDCPWRLHVAKHQHVNITLWDFTSINDNDVCRVYGTIRDRMKPNAFTICGGGPRVRHIYAASETTLEIRMSVGKISNRPQDFFLLKYEGKNIYRHNIISDKDGPHACKYLNR